MTQRIRRHPFLALFDGPDPNASTAKRSITTVPTQALFFMNDPFVHEQAEGFARRLLAAHADEADRIRLAYRMALAAGRLAEELEGPGLPGRGTGGSSGSMESPSGAPTAELVGLRPHAVRQQRIRLRRLIPRSARPDGKREPPSTIDPRGAMPSDWRPAASARSP